MGPGDAILSGIFRMRSRERDASRALARQTARSKLRGGRWHGSTAIQNLGRRVRRPARPWPLPVSDRFSPHLFEAISLESRGAPVGNAEVIGAGIRITGAVLVPKEDINLAGLARIVARKFADAGQPRT